MDPAVHASLAPKACPMPSKATPMVAIVVHDEPDSSDTSAQMTHDDTRKNYGDITCTP